VQECRIVATFDVTNVLHMLDGPPDIFVEMCHAAKGRIVLGVADGVGPDVVHPGVVNLTPLRCQSLERKLNYYCLG